jgi:hypothetical protein
VALVFGLDLMPIDEGDAGGEFVCGVGRGADAGGAEGGEEGEKDSGKGWACVANC